MQSVVVKFSSKNKGYYLLHKQIRRLIPDMSKCMHACMHIYECMLARNNYYGCVCMCVCLCVCMYVCMYVCM